jgi:isoleucyl-tRNA synthetase
VKGRAPYRQVITHGFVVDENGVPYSKSTLAAAKAAGKKTSYIEPSAVIQKYGAEMFRLWVASVEFRSDIPYSQTMLDGLSEWYRKLRNTARFLLGNLAGFDPNQTTREVVTLGIDRYMLARVDDVVARAKQAYDAYELHVVHRLLVEFITTDVSALYSDVAKDRLYSDAGESPARRAAQVVLYECLRAIATLAAPILCFTAEDIWTHMPKRAGDPSSVHLAAFPDVKDWDRQAIISEFAVLLAWRERSTKALEPFRAAKNRSVDAQLVLHPTAADQSVLAKYAGELADLFIVSDVELGAVGEGTVDVASHAGPRCERCWKHFAKLATTPNDVCDRCAAALTARGWKDGAS